MHRYSANTPITVTRWCSWVTSQVINADVLAVCGRKSQDWSVAQFGGDQSDGKSKPGGVCMRLKV